MDEVDRGNHFEDLPVGRRFRHATSRTITSGDASLYLALTGARQPLFCCKPLAIAAGYRATPLDDLLVFNIAFGKTVPDISVNAVANLGYADVRFLRPIYADATISVETTVIRTRVASSGDRGVVFVRSTAIDQEGAAVLTWTRWVLVRARGRLCGEPASKPELPAFVASSRLSVPAFGLDASSVVAASGSDRFWEDYRPGDRLDHPSGMTLDESDHVFATRLYQNTARVHFDARRESAIHGRRRLVYGGHVISLCRALSYDGLENALTILAINGGSHAAPTFAGDTLYGLSQVLDVLEIPGRSDVGALRLRLVGLKNRTPAQVRDEELHAAGGLFFYDLVMFMGVF